MVAIPGHVAEFIAAGRVGRLATASASGQPLVVPICYAFDGAMLFSAIDAKPKRVGGERLARVRNIRDNPRVSVVIDHYEEDWTRLRYVVIQGDAEVVTGGPAYDRGATLLLDKYPQYATLPVSAGDRAMIAVTPRDIISWSFAR